MTTRITTAEIPHVIVLLRAKLVEAGLGAWEIEPWLTKASARLTHDHATNACAYFLAYLDGEPIAMAGALLRHDHAFLSLRTNRYGCVVDEYILPAHRGRDLEQPLRTNALTWIAANAATVRTETAPPSNAARLAASSGGGKL